MSSLSFLKSHKHLHENGPLPKHCLNFSCQHVSPAATGELNLWNTAEILVTTAGMRRGAARHSSRVVLEQSKAHQLPCAAPGVTVTSSSRPVLPGSGFLLLSSAKSVGLSQVVPDAARADIANIAREQITRDSVALFWQFGHLTHHFARDY